MPSAKKITAAYRLAQEAYAELGVDTDAAITRALGCSDFASLLAGGRCPRA